MSYILKPTRQFRNDVKRAKKRGYDLELLIQALDMLAEGQTLPPAYRDHQLEGEYSGCRECHICPDWLLIYRLAGDSLYLYLMRTGTHSDLF